MFLNSHLPIIVICNIILFFLKDTIKKTYYLEYPSKFIPFFFVVVVIISLFFFIFYRKSDKEKRKIILKQLLNLFTWLVIFFTGVFVHLYYGNSSFMQAVVYGSSGFAIMKCFWSDDQLLKEAKRYVVDTYGAFWLSFLDFKQIIKESQNSAPKLYPIIDKAVLEQQSYRSSWECFFLEKVSSTVISIFIQVGVSILLQKTISNFWFFLQNRSEIVEQVTVNANTNVNTTTLQTSNSTEQVHSNLRNNDLGTNMGEVLPFLDPRTESNALWTLQLTTVADLIVRVLRAEVNLHERSKVALRELKLDLDDLVFQIFEAFPGFTNVTLRKQRKVLDTRFPGPGNVVGNEMSDPYGTAARVLGKILEN